MKHLLTIILLTCCIQAAQAEKIVKRISTKAAGELVLTCNNPDSWKISTQVEQADGKEYLHINLHSATQQVPPKFKVTYTLAQKDISHLWHPRATTPYRFHPNWSGSSWQNSQLAYSIPIVAFFNDHNQNSFLMACSEVFRSVNTQMAIREEGCDMQCEINFFDSPVAPMSDYETVIRFDSRKVFWADAIREATAWIDEAAHITPCHIPDDAYAPLYSSWYQFHQNVFAKDIEEECAIASQLGMKTIIIDDGWQTDNNNRGYAFCGDWEVSKNRFPDMASHVRKVQKMGMKYMMWYSVPFVGYYSKNYKTFKGKYLRNDDNSKASVLDPRFPEVREFLASTYEKAMKEWGIDGFKLDFIDQFKLPKTDPAIAEDYAGRDYKSVPEATDALMKEIKKRIMDVNPNALIEFRQAYMGPAIRQYGNMIRVGDCPGDMTANRIGIANLRLTSGNTAVHADMLEWNKAESALNASRTILSCMFGVIQYSVMLRDIPEDHQKVIRHWLSFSQKHQETLLKSEFKPYSPEAGFPLIEAQSKDERIIGVYQDNICLQTGTTDRKIYILNATCTDHIIADIPANANMTTFDMFGNNIRQQKVKAGIQRMAIPAGGYALLD